MGGCLSRQPPDPDSPQALARDTQFSVAEVHALQTLFTRLSNKLHQDNLMHKDEFALALFQDTQRSSLFADRLFDIFDAKHNDVVDFGEFVRALSVFHPRTPLEDKAEVAFQLYDLDGTGVISRGEVRRLLAALLRDNPALALDEPELEDVIARTFEELDVLRNGVITPAEWLLAVRESPETLRFMTIPELRDVSTRYAATLLGGGAQQGNEGALENGGAQERGGARHNGGPLDSGGALVNGGAQGQEPEQGRGRAAEGRERGRGQGWSVKQGHTVQDKGKGKGEERRPEEDFPRPWRRSWAGSQ